MFEHFTSEIFVSISVQAFLKMFGLFHDPYAYYGYQPRRIVRVYNPFFGYQQRPIHRNYDPFGINSLSAYMHALDHPFNHMFDYYEEEEAQPEFSTQEPVKDEKQ